MKKGQLPEGWVVVRDSVWIRGRLIARTTVYRCEREGLAVRRGGGRKWILIHNFHDTGHRFKTAREAVEHAQDVIFHGH